MPGRVAAVLLLIITGHASRAQSAPATPAIGADAVAVPSLAFDEQPEMVKAYDKYFYFHRDGTTFPSGLHAGETRIGEERLFTGGPACHFTLMDAPEDQDG